MKATLSGYRQAPRKVRLVANLIKGKTVSRALVELAVLPKRASEPMKKLVLSAVANAKENNKINSIDDLLIKSIRVDKGVVLKRSRPRSRGQSAPVHKHTSHVVIELIEHVEVKATTEKKSETPKAKVAEKVTAKPAKKTAPKKAAKK